jgi:hypothetical protein
MPSVSSIREHLRRRAWFEGALALVTGVLAIVTLFWHDWIEALTGYDPDAHRGSVEWLIVAALAVVCVIASIALRAEWRRARATGDVQAFSGA